MRVYLTPPQPSRGLDRIATALRRYAPPDVEVCEFPRNVDLTVIYAIGRRNGIQRQVEDILSRGKQYAIIQCCLRSTMSASTHDWLDIWKYAEVLWSYYDLEQARIDDGGCASCEMPNFYHAPLGADAEVFRFYGGRDNEYARGGNGYVIATSGLSRLQESVRECELAADVVGRHMFHLGRRVTGKPHVTCATGISDLQLARVYSTCEFVSGLRRTEGFELPAVEGLLCGARPVLFDTPDYRQWYEPWGEFIHEGTRQEVVDQLVELFRRGARPVSSEERQQAVERFNWETIVKGFWERVQ